MMYMIDDDIRAALRDIIEKMDNDNFKPEIIVGLNRGGLIPSVMLSHYYNCDHYVLNVRLRDGNEVPTVDSNVIFRTLDKPTLIVDDINDTGATFQWIKDNWLDVIEDIKDIRTAALLEKVTSNFKVNYTAHTLNEEEGTHWVVFPYENWWNYNERFS